MFFTPVIVYFITCLEKRSFQYKIVFLWEFAIGLWNCFFKRVMNAIFHLTTKMYTYCTHNFINFK